MLAPAFVLTTAMIIAATTSSAVAIPAPIHAIEHANYKIDERGFFGSNQLGLFNFYNSDDIGCSEDAFITPREIPMNVCFQIEGATGTMFLNTGLNAPCAGAGVPTAKLYSDNQCSNQLGPYTAFDNGPVNGGLSSLTQGQCGKPDEAFYVLWTCPDGIVNPSNF